MAPITASISVRTGSELRQVGSGKRATAQHVAERILCAGADRVALEFQIARVVQQHPDYGQFELAGVYPRFDRRVVAAGDEALQGRP